MAEATAGKPDHPPLGPIDVPFVGRANEIEQLSTSLRDALEGNGSAWLVDGPAGMGKTRLIHYLAESAKKEGFWVRWGYCLKEVMTPFFAFQQIFRNVTSEAGDDPIPESSRPLPTLLLFEEDKPVRLLGSLTSIGRSHPCLIVSRERPAKLRQQSPALSPSVQMLWLSKGEGEDLVHPGEIDLLGERLASFFTENFGGVVAMMGLEYLTSQNSFLAVLRLVQFLRDLAEEYEGHLLLSFNPSAFEKKEVFLLQAEGEVVPDSRPTQDSPVSPEAPSTTMLRYLSATSCGASSALWRGNERPVPQPAC